MLTVNHFRMDAVDDVLHQHPIVRQLVQSLKQQGFDSQLDIHDGYLTLTIKLFATNTSSVKSAKDTSIDSEPLIRKKKFMQSLLGPRRYFDDREFLTPHK